MVAENPRARGANDSVDHHVDKYHGNPPRSRGELEGAVSPAVRLWKTPALAGRTFCTGQNTGPLTENPRARGANDWIRDLRREMTGKPPRSRGELDSFLQAESYAGKTPALAGRTWLRTASQSASKENPRARGANGFVLAGLVFIVGKTPRSRGERCLRDQRGLKLRKTPALAGRTLTTR